MECLIFDTLQKAIDQEAVISLNMGIPSSKTVRWANIEKCEGLSKWWVQKPEDQYMAGVSDYTIENYSDAWRPPQEG